LRSNVTITGSRFSAPRLISRFEKERGMPLVFVAILTSLQNLIRAISYHDKENIVRRRYPDVGQ
jgi:hypothetical protein